MAGYVLGSPIIHAVNGQPKSAFTSLLLRIFLPYAGAQIGLGTRCNVIGCRVGAALLLGGVGVITATSIDLVFLAEKTEFVTPQRPLIRYGPMVANPGLALTLHGDLILNLNGSF